MEKWYQFLQQNIAGAHDRPERKERQGAVQREIREAATWRPLGTERGVAALTIYTKSVCQTGREISDWPSCRSRPTHLYVATVL
jgi:hypothetical protein